MLEGLSIPLALKVCAAAVVVGGAGVATVEVVSSDDTKTDVIVESPDALGFADGDAVEKSTEVKETEAHDDPPVEEAKFTEPVASEKIDEVKDEDESTGDDKDDHEDDEKTSAEPDVAPAAVTILWPEDGSHHEKPNVVFEGEASVGSRVFAGPYEATVDEKGQWRIELILSPGANKATIKAEDPLGNIAEDSVTAWLDVEEEPVEKEEKVEKGDEGASVAFSANQKYGFCEEAVPYDVFWGTATPNTVVQITSPYGSTNVEVGKKGHWEKKLYFEGAPRGQAFAVTITADNGSKTFEFVAKVIEEASEGHGDKK